MHDVIALGSLTLDLFFRDDSLTISHDRFALALGGKYVANEFHDSLGGGGANVIIGIARAGLRGGLWSQIGVGGLSLYIRDQLTQEHIDLDLLEQEADFSNISTILLSARGERTIITHRSHDLQLETTPERLAALKECRLFFMGNMPEIPLEERDRLVGVVHESGHEVALNFGVKDCRRGLSALSSIFSKASLVFLNRYELGDVLDVKPTELLPNEINYHRALYLNDSAIAIITDGEFGSYAHTKSDIFYQPALQLEKVTDTTGAGDAFTSGFIAAHLYKHSIPECLERGARNSQSVISYVGAQKGLLNKEALGL